MAKPDFSSFTKEALLAILNALGVSAPNKNNMSVAELARLVSESEVAIGEKAFAEAVAQAQGLSVVPSASQQTAGSKPTGTGTGGAPAAKNLAATAGHKVVEVTLPRRDTDAGLAAYSIKSETYDPRSSNY